jgi:hypothetical protein
MLGRRAMRSLFHAGALSACDLDVVVQPAADVAEYQ